MRCQEIFPLNFPEETHQQSETDCQQLCKSKLLPIGQRRNGTTPPSTIPTLPPSYPKWQWDTRKELPQAQLLRQQHHTRLSTQAVFRHVGARCLGDTAITVVLYFRGTTAHYPGTIHKHLPMLYPLLGSRDTLGHKISTLRLLSLFHSEVPRSTSTSC